MPKDTFLNLPEEKRRLIEDAALNEFSEYGYEASSINRIVAAAGIAKGSFYQYFEDKGDLYKHIMLRIGEQKLAYITPVLQNPADYDFFTYLEELHRTGLAFARDNPTAAQIGFEVYKNQSNPIFAEVYQKSKAQGYAFYESLLDMAISRGEVDAEIDKAFIIHMLTYLQVASFDYYLETVKAGEMDATNWTDDYMPTVRMMIDFIKNGIQRQIK